MTETTQRLYRSCLIVVIVMGVFLGILLILGIGVALYSIQVGRI